MKIENQNRGSAGRACLRAARAGTGSDLSSWNGAPGGPRRSRQVLDVGFWRVERRGASILARQPHRLAIEDDQNRANRRQATPNIRASRSELRLWNNRKPPNCLKTCSGRGFSYGTETSPAAPVEPEPEAITCEQLPAVVYSCTQPEIEIVVHPEREEGVEGKEGKEVTTPIDLMTSGLSEVSVAEQAQLTTGSPDTFPDDHDMTGLRKLAAVLVRAFEDARCDSVARRWFEVTPQPMLKFWCEVAGLDQARVRRKAIEAIKQNKVMTATM